MGSFWSGVAHLLTSFDQVGCFVGLAICAGFQERHGDARVIGAAFAAVLIGAVAGAGNGAPVDILPLTATLMVAVGLSGAARWQAGGGPVLALASVAGLLAGAESSDGALGLSLALFSLGGAVAAASLLSYGLIAARGFEAAWAVIALRASASWIAAIGLMTLALAGSRYFGHR